MIDPGVGTYRLYKGTEEQMPDPFIEAMERIGNVPAYRGLAYIVLEDFPLGEFGNYIPYFIFEVQRRHILYEHTKDSAEQLVRSMVMIPGSAEFVYDPVIQHKQSAAIHQEAVVAHGFKERINHHNHTK